MVIGWREGRARRIGRLSPNLDQAPGTVARLNLFNRMDRGEARYQAVKDGDLGWSVVDRLTGHVLRVRNLPMLCLSEYAARTLADYVNRFGDLLSTLH